MKILYVLKSIQILISSSDFRVKIVDVPPKATSTSFKDAVRNREYELEQEYLVGIVAVNLVKVIYFWVYEVAEDKSGNVGGLRLREMSWVIILPYS